MKKRLEQVKERIRQAAESCNRDADSIRLVAVSKTIAADTVREAIEAGVTILGENYVQEARDKFNALVQYPVSWHFIGHLQSNKAAAAAELFQMIQTVDRLKIAAALNSHAERLGKHLDVLVQVNVGKESQKSGVLPENAEELLRDMQQLAHLRLRGLMTMPPYSQEPEKSRFWFRTLKQLSVQLAEEELFYDNSAVELSMGLSGDFVVAVEEGATMIRIGTAIFGERKGVQIA